MDASNYVANNYILEGLEKDEESRLLSCFTRIKFKAGDFVFRENEEGNQLFLVETGLVVVRRWITEGNIEKILLTAEQGGIFGEMSFMDSGLRTASAFVERDSVVQALSRSEFDLFCEKYPLAGTKVLNNLLRIIVERLRGTTDAYIDAVQYNVQVSGSEQMGFHHLIASSMAVEITLTNGKSVTGTIIQVDKSEAGHQLIIRKTGEGLVMIPYHSIVTITFDADL